MVHGAVVTARLEQLARLLEKSEKALPRGNVALVVRETHLPMQKT